MTLATADPKKEANGHAVNKNYEIERIKNAEAPTLFSLSNRSVIGMKHWTMRRRNTEVYDVADALTKTKSLVLLEAWGCPSQLPSCSQEQT